MVPHQQQRADAGFREADNAFAPFTLKCGRRGTISVGIPSKDYQINFFGYGSINDGIERLEEIKDAHWQARFGVVPAIIGHINVGIGEMEEFHNLVVE